MSVRSLTLEFITPCFCAGADQSKAEIRAPSIRGELRWWFRVLGGTPAQEKSVFGGVNGEVAASKLVVRVSDFRAIHEELPPECFRVMSDLAYIYYFANASGKISGDRRGPRVHPDAFLSPGTTFTLDVIARRPPAPEECSLLTMALDAFVRLGTLGLRATRGCGAMTEPNRPLTRPEFCAWAKTLPNVAVGLAKDAEFASWDKCQKELGLFLRTFRKETHHRGDERSALGYVTKEHHRESSALRLRPVKMSDGFLPVVFYTDSACNQTSIANQFRSFVTPLH